MTATAYINGHVLAQGRLQEGLAIIVNGEHIEAVVSNEQAIRQGLHTINLDGSYVLPGFIDTQVNGGGGLLFNTSPDLAGIKTIGEAHWQFGTTGFLPTLISDDLEVIRQGVAAVNAAIEQKVPGVLGIHIEGPFLAGNRRGVHDATKIQPLTEEIIKTLEPVIAGCSMLTLAPETVSPEMIRTLTDKGFIVCAGHSNASFEQVNAAIEQGLRGFTHLFNAMSPLTAREPGMVGAALDAAQTWCGIIADNHHVSPASLRIACQCIGPEKLMLVTDAMPPVGTDQIEFSMLGKKITVTDGVCRDPDGTLAGTALDMASALRNFIKDTGCSLPQASKMASANPAEFLGLHELQGNITSGQRADFVITDEDLIVKTTLIGGKAVYSKAL